MIVKKTVNFLWHDRMIVVEKITSTNNKITTTIHIKDSYCFSYINEIVPEALTRIAGWLSDLIVISVVESYFDTLCIARIKEGTIVFKDARKSKLVNLKTAVSHIVIRFDRCTFCACKIHKSFSLIGTNNVFVDTQGVKTEHINCPSDGEFIGWKMCGHCLVKLKIPASAQRTSGSSSKSRCSYAYVEEIYEIPSNPFLPIRRKETVESTMYPTKAVTYKRHKMVYADSFDDSKDMICTHGIHFYIDKREALSMIAPEPRIDAIIRRIENLEAESR